jgi:putative transposase
MPRKKFIASNEYAYNVSARCINKEWFSLPMHDLWIMFADYLFFIHHAFGVRIHSFVLMNNHFHLIVRTPNMNLDKAMNYFMRETSRIIGFRSGRINQVYGGPYHWSLIKSPKYYNHAYKYVYRNPVEAGLSSKVENYEYSTLSVLLGNQHSMIPIEYDETLFSDFTEQLQWLNTPYPSTDIKHDIRKALRKTEFHFAKDKSGKPHFLEDSIV